MNSDLVPDDLWTRIAPMLPRRPQRRHRYAGRHRTCDRIALVGITFVLRTGVTWRDVPRQEVGRSGVTAWRRRSHRMRRRRKPCSQAMVRSTTQRNVPRPEPCSTPRSAMTGRMPRCQSSLRYLSWS
ncbi:transposase [Streptomyces adustus]|uniref:Transposase n=1 Tax=Streptomyces adustus TaxID=1609272 RepID=A0A5N8V445_9ACTN|nr:transposase [Streptomyces adustus]